MFYLFLFDFVCGEVVDRYIDTLAFLQSTQCVHNAVGVEGVGTVKVVLITHRLLVFLFRQLLSVKRMSVGELAVLCSKLNENSAVEQTLNSMHNGCFLSLETLTFDLSTSKSKVHLCPQVQQSCTFNEIPKRLRNIVLGLSQNVHTDSQTENLRSPIWCRYKQELKNTCVRYEPTL